jgi:hypothetical protein
VDAGNAWCEDFDAPGEEEESDFWEDDELTPEELTRWFKAAHEADRAFAAARCPAPGDAEGCGPAAWPRAEGSVPDLIAAVLAAGGDPALMTDAELAESVAAWHAVGSRAAGRELRATVELLRRRKPRTWDRRADRAERAREDRDGALPGAPGGSGGAPERVMSAVVASREAAAEIALALTATEYSAQVQAALAAGLSRRHPAAFGELDAGRADLARVRVLAEAAQFLSDEDAGKVDALLAPELGQMTTGELRSRARRAVIAIDAKAADRRRERAERKARFALYGNDDQTATAAVERMPAHLGAAVKARVNAIARAARAAGMPGPMPLLEAKIATGLLLDTLPQIPPPAGDTPADGPPADVPGGPRDPGPAEDPWDGGWPADWFTGSAAPAGAEGPAPADGAGPVFDDAGGDPGPEDPSLVDPGRDHSSGNDPGPEDPSPVDFGPRDADSGEPGPASPGPPDVGSGKPEPTSAAMSWPPILAQAGAAAPGCPGLPPWLRPRHPGRIRLIAPWRTLTGTGPEPGELSWTGPVTPDQARALAAAAARDPNCTWQLIVTDDEGRAIATTTLRTRHDTSTAPPGLVSEVTITISQALSAAYGQAPGRPGFPDAGTGALADLLAQAIPAANLAAAHAAATAAADRDAGGCAHTMETPGYRVPGRLRRWLNTRDRTCRNPVCRQPATRCDQDHTLAHHRGGRTCCCNLGSLCRYHHELKQLPRWQLTQDDQGYFTWRTPSGLTYRKEPHRYPI